MPDQPPPTDAQQPQAVRTGSEAPAMPNSPLTHPGASSGAAQPTAQAMKIAVEMLSEMVLKHPTGGLSPRAWCAVNPVAVERTALRIDEWGGLPAMLKNVDDAEAVASDLFTVQELIGGKLRERDGLDTWTENGIEHVRLGVSTVTVDVPDDVTGLFPEVKGSTRQFPWKARLIASDWLAKSGEYELVYEILSQDERA